jgi:hypothetical protein
MDAARRPLSSLDAWPGEPARPPLRLLESQRVGPRVASGTPRTPRPGWLQRLRQALSAG